MVGRSLAAGRTWSRVVVAGRGRGRAHRPSAASEHDDDTCAGRGPGVGGVVGGVGEVEGGRRWPVTLACTDLLV